MPSTANRALDATRRHLAREGRIAAADATAGARNARASLHVLALSILIASLMGVAGRAFLAALEVATVAHETHRELFLLLPVVAGGTAWLYRNHGLRAQRGNNLVIDSTLGGSPIHKRMGFLTFFCSTATHLAGGSAGREGAAVQMGGTIASNVAEIFHVSGHDRRDLMMAGISSAFGAAFGAPLAGAFFGMEMCFIGKLDYSAALYCLTGSFVGNAVSRALGSSFAFQSIASVPSMDAGALAATLVLAVILGCTANLFTLAIRAVKRIYARAIPHYFARAIVGGALLAALFLLGDLTRYGGLSEWMVASAFAGTTNLVDALLKLLLTALTLGIGLQGGEVTPLFGIGAALGGWMGAQLLGDPSFMAALGMVGLFAAALNVPVTAIMLGIDMFGAGAGGYFVIVSFIAYLAAGHNAIYPAQRIVTPKRRSLKGEVELSVDEAIERRRSACDGRAEAPGRERLEPESAEGTGEAYPNTAPCGDSSKAASKATPVAGAAIGAASELDTCTSQPCPERRHIICSGTGSEATRANAAHRDTQTD